MSHIDLNKTYNIQIYQNGTRIGFHRNCQIKDLHSNMIILKTEFDDEEIYMGNTLAFRITDSSSHKSVHD